MYSEFLLLRLEQFYMYVTRADKLEMLSLLSLGVILTLSP